MTESKWMVNNSFQVVECQEVEREEDTIYVKRKRKNGTWGETSTYAVPEEELFNTQAEAQLHGCAKATREFYNAVGKAQCILTYRISELR